MFQNLQLYRLSAGFTSTPDALASQLTRGAFQPCGPNDQTSEGWVEAHPGAGLVYAQNGQRLLCYRTESKIIPASYVAEVTKAKADELEQSQGFRPGRKQMRELKVRVKEELLPRALPRTARTLVWIDNTNGWLAMDTSSKSRCEDIISHLRRCMDTLPVIAFPKTRLAPTSCMTSWLSTGDAPDHFTIDRECELRDRTVDKGVVRYRGVNIDTQEVRNQITAGGVTTRVALTWNDRISFVLDGGLGIKRLQILDVLKEDLAQANENADDLFASSVALSTGELAKLIADVITACGGEMPDEDSASSPIPF